MMATPDSRIDQSIRVLTWLMPIYRKCLNTLNRVRKNIIEEQGCKAALPATGSTLGPVTAMLVKAYTPYRTVSVDDNVRLVH